MVKSGRLERMLRTRPLVRPYIWAHRKNYERAVQTRHAEWLASDMLFVHVPKTAGMSISQALGRPDPGHYLLTDSLEWRRSLGLDSDQLFIFSVVRDPVERVVSTWNFAYRQDVVNRGIGSALSLVRSYQTLPNFVSSPTFATYVEHHYFWWPQAKYLAGVSSDRIKLLRFDRVDTDAKKLLGLELPTVNATPGDHRLRADELPQETVDLIRAAYSQDFELLKKADQQNG